jgi:hypothetical protein
MVIFSKIRKLGYNKITFGKNNFINMIGRNPCTYVRNGFYGSATVISGPGMVHNGCKVDIMHIRFHFAKLE